MLKVYVADTLVDGQLVLDQLRSDGVPAELFHQNGAGGLGDLPVVNPEVWIRRNQDLDKATRVIQRLNNQQTMSGMQHCSNCDESNPPTFEICWQCHAELC